MQLGFVGLGKMGLNMVARLVTGGHAIVSYDRDAPAIARAKAAGARGAADLKALVAALLPPRNANFHDDIRRAETLGAKDLHYVDAGTSGGVWGLKEGYCLMVGGEEDVCVHLEPIFLTLAPKDGYLYVGGHGAGHYVKMIHNGTEYGLMQAYAEGFQLMHASEYHLDVGAIASLWMHRSVVRSWLLELTALALAENPDLAGIKGYVKDSGEGRWTLHEGVARAVALPALTAALFTRFRSRGTDPFAERLLAALRNQFSRHAIRKRDA